MGFDPVGAHEIIEQTKSLPFIAIKRTQPFRRPTALPDLAVHPRLSNCLPCLGM
jgi:hypothetical protein